MKDPAYFQRMFAYDAWANKATLASIHDMSDNRQRPLTLFSHILGAQKMWHHRLTGEDTTGMLVWPVIHDSDLSAQIEECYGNWWEFLNNIDPDEFDESIDYTNTQGREFTNTVCDVLSHVLMHSMYHRAQIAMVIKEGGGTPATTDFITYARTANVGASGFDYSDDE